jgi:DNA-binding HxlR family transcriptional regulator
MPKLPGQPSQWSKTGKPVMVLLDVLGQRWTLRVLWELRESPTNFRELQTRCDDVSPTVLNKRLRELRDLSLVEHSVTGYGLTIHGKALIQQLLPLNLWAEEWAQSFDDSTATK